MKGVQSILFSQKAAPYIFILPFIISLSFFWVYPMISTIIMSFQDIGTGYSEFIGLANYEKLLGDSVFHTAVKNSVLYTIFTIIILIPLPMLCAFLLNSKNVVAKRTYKSIIYLPALVSVVVSGILFRYMFSEMDSGLMNQILNFFGIDSTQWLKNWGTGMFALLLLATWRWMGVNTLYFEAGLSSIDKVLYESAEVDGANAWQKFWHITLPLLKPTRIYVTTISIYGGMAMFLESYMIYGGNSSPKNIGLTIVGYLYRRGIEKNDLGYASAVGLVLLIVALAISMVYLWSSGMFKKEDK
ncbi:sugar ABC transporter permease [Caldibacillus lycopersici]|uniref:Sugar ABC transporter permease n=1 Tax=Perspicuibacillus lycopersici TaxID=1325689 RepID=A0AAE3IWZ5_9BACI|nr:sugar ABC transporter permease [Perspicuibacillus lycopersici]MCU9615123.1 sugar ABC transporter permease [Perspicuibacillus lycopersici]